MYMSEKTSKKRTLLVLVFTAVLCFAMTAGLWKSTEKGFAAAGEDYSLLYQLDFSDEQNIGKNTAEDSSFEDAEVPESNQFTVVDGVKGKKALNFVGGTYQENYLSLPTEIFENQNSVTISGWFFLPKGVESYLGEIGIYSADNDVAFRSDPYAVYHANAYLYCVGPWKEIDGGVGSGVKPVYDAWYHMAYVIDGVNHTFTVYENSAEVLEIALDEGFTPSQYHSETSHFYLGQSAYSGYHEENTHNDYKGKMSDIRVYSGALTVQDIKDEYGLTFNDFKTTEYAFDEADNYYKDSVRGYDLKAFNGTPTFEDGVMTVQDGVAAQAFNKEDNLNVNFFDGHASFTISMDLNIETPSDDSHQWKRIMDMCVGSGYRITFMSACPREPGNVFDIVYNYDKEQKGDQNLLNNDSFVLPNGKWFNLTIVMDGSLNTISVYEDGILKVSAAVAEDRPGFSQFFYDMGTEGGNFTFGTYVNELQNYIDASYDNIRIWAVAATADDVKNIIGEPTVSYTLQYDANGGTGTMESVSVKEDQKVVLADNKFQKEGYEFTGWNTQADGKGTSYKAGQEVSLTENTVLYAQWKINSHFITFDANGGRGVMEKQAVKFETSVKVNGCGFLKTGYTFNGWNTKADGTGKAYAAGGEISLSEDITLYAQWKAKEYTVTFNANGGLGTMDKQKFVYGTESVLTKNAFTRTGYTFAGWSYTEEGAAVFEDGQKITGILEGNDITLYAVWEIGSYKVTFDANGGTGTMEAVTGKGLSFVTLTENAFTKENAVFLGWSLSPDGEVVYEDGAKIVLESNMTLYAVWKNDGGTTPPVDDGSKDEGCNCSSMALGDSLLIAGGVLLAAAVVFIAKRKKS